MQSTRVRGQPDGGHRFIRSLLYSASATRLARAMMARAIMARAIMARAIMARAIISRAIMARAIMARAIMARAIMARAIMARAIIEGSKNGIHNSRIKGQQSQDIKKNRNKVNI